MWRLIQTRCCSYQSAVPTEMTVRVKSLRIDNFIAKTTSLSRNKSELAIKSALIGVDGVPVLKPSKEIYAGIVIDYIKDNENGVLKLTRWQNVDVEPLENPKPNGTKYEITYDIIKSMEIPLSEYKDNVKNAVEIERQARDSEQAATE